jgi:hypothetical protein
MRLESYTVREYGGRHSGSISTRYKDDAIVLDREDIAYVMKALRRGRTEDKEFAKKMFDMMCPHTYCDCCGRRLNDDENSVHAMYSKTLCYKCWFIMGDIDYIRSMKKYGDKSAPLDMLKSVQKSREEWCPKNINYLVNERTLEKCIKKYNEIFKGTRSIGDEAQ